ncbi:hypothetical protein T4B_2995 [Trichinella pseudospiralis]|uniref:Uncharacterized protein n=1 Tax=Trichinella pseudospiralis TaxID=6337 RepID=A0A0V1DS22_TRIPS|nr:hypothetical protein T4A_9035 [Trichinella pseudospiralis]KRY99641.1 hypothetical protein T4B_6985 [Trichinella pseudospiralis]KRZ00084.1 hypothetical protein T4B_2995 [Trichinella pseudospiralis]KRZ20549.1 hypothetical protein T4C_2285 [Trichinella pseudospiralis]
MATELLIVYMCVGALLKFEDPILLTYGIYFEMFT